MRSPFLPSLLGLFALAACSTPAPQPTDSGAPTDTSDVATDTRAETGADAADVPGTDTAPDTAMDVTTDTPADNPQADVSSEGGTSGMAWCDLPMGPDAMVRGVTLPAGFCVRRYARLAHPRVMAFSSRGDLFITSPGLTGPGGTGPGISAIAVLPDDNRDGVADAVSRYAELTSGVPGFGDFQSVHGILFANNFMYFSVQNGVYRVPFTGTERRVATGVRPEVVADLSDSERWTHTLAQGPDGTVYVSMGIYGSSQCPYPSPRRAAVLAIGAGHSTMGDIVARGFRNPMYIRCHAWGCYAAELTDDGWTAPGREKILRFENGQDYGYPCCYDRDFPSPANGGRVMCNTVTPSLIGFPVGYTPFGHDFAPSGWSGMYAGALFVGLHGQVGSWNNTGINWAPVDAATHTPMGATAQTFMMGWGRGTPNEGRVADLAFAPDGRLFFTDDQQGHVYWIAPTTLRVP